jgi:hypothetical protein
VPVELDAAPEPIRIGRCTDEKEQRAGIEVEQLAGTARLNPAQVPVALEPYHAGVAMDRDVGQLLDPIHQIA